MLLSRALPFLLLGSLTAFASPAQAGEGSLFVPVSYGSSYANACGVYLQAPACRAWYRAQARCRKNPARRECRSVRTPNFYY